MCEGALNGHPREGGDPVLKKENGAPACAGATHAVTNGAPAFAGATHAVTNGAPACAGVTA
jgi:hypothetical protein